MSTLGGGCGVGVRGNKKQQVHNILQQAIQNRIMKNWENLLGVSCTSAISFDMIRVFVACTILEGLVTKICDYYTHS